MDCSSVESLVSPDRLKPVINAGVRTLRTAGRLAIGVLQKRVVDPMLESVGLDTYGDLEHAANVNSINGCYTRRKFFKKLDKAISVKKPASAQVTFVDAVGFGENINNGYGHSVGDTALAVSGWAMRELFTNSREEEADGPLVGSFGGDEFICVVLARESLNEESPLFFGCLSYYQYDGDEGTEDRVSFNMKNMLYNIEDQGVEHAQGIHDGLRNLIDVGLETIDFRYVTDIVQIRNGDSAHTIVDSFIHDNPIKGATHVRHSSRD